MTWALGQAAASWDGATLTTGVTLTIPSGTDMLIVTAGQDGAAGTPAYLRIDGVDMTNDVSRNDTARNCSIWRMDNPPIGSVSLTGPNTVWDGWYYCVIGARGNPRATASTKSGESPGDNSYGITVDSDWGDFVVMSVGGADGCGCPGGTGGCVHHLGTPPTGCNPGGYRWGRYPTTSCGCSNMNTDRRWSNVGASYRPIAGESIGPSRFPGYIRERGFSPQQFFHQYRRYGWIRGTVPRGSQTLANARVSLPTMEEAQN